MAAREHCIAFHPSNTGDKFLLLVESVKRFLQFMMQEDSSEAPDIQNHEHNDNLEERVREWLETSGKKTELQTKVRAELFAAIQTELAFRLVLMRLQV